MSDNHATGSELERQALGNRIDSLRRQQRLTLAELALKAGYDERTIRNAVSGKSIRPKTLLHICQAVGIQDPGKHLEVAEISDDRHGKYSRSATRHYVGHYCAYRWSYDGTRNIIKSIFHMDWSSTSQCIEFTEHQKYKDAHGRLVDFSQSGEMYSSGNTRLRTHKSLGATRWCVIHGGSEVSDVSAVPAAPG